jgi:hypothetical protein
MIPVLAAGLASFLMSTSALAANGTVQFGPFHSTSIDNGCSGPWATDTFDRYFKVHDNRDGTFAVTEDFKNGTFVTQQGASPGATCVNDPHHGTLVNGGVKGSFQGFLTGSVTSGTFNQNGCSALLADCTTTTGFLTAVFGAEGPATFACDPGSSECFNFEYNSSDKSLQYHHWQDKADNQGGEQFIGDIANQ